MAPRCMFLKNTEPILMDTNFTSFPTLHQPILRNLNGPICCCHYSSVSVTQLRECRAPSSARPRAGRWFILYKTLDLQNEQHGLSSPGRIHTWLGPCTSRAGRATLSFSALGSPHQASYPAIGPSQRFAFLNKAASQGVEHFPSQCSNDTSSLLLLQLSSFCFITIS